MIVEPEPSVDGGKWIKITDKHPNKSVHRAQWNAPALAWKVPAINSDNVRLRVSETGGKASTIGEPFSIKPAKGRVTITRATNH